MCACGRSSCPSCNPGAREWRTVESSESSQWKPGDVAMVTFDNASLNMRQRGETDIVTQVGLRREDDWGLASYGCSIDDSHITGVRPLVVIDPEANPYHKGTGSWIDWIEEQYLAQSRPPKPEEPTGLGAVVRDSEGLQWVRATFADADYYGWRCANRPQGSALYRWPEVDAIEVLSEGVQS